MTEDARAAGLSAFQDQTDACLDEINAMMLDLTRRYDMTVIAAAMAEQVGVALRALRRKTACDDEDAELTIERIALRAFGPHPA